MKNVFPGATVIESPWFGYPTVGAPRRVRPTLLGVLHVTAGMGDAAATTRWGINVGGRSWTFCVNRDGSVVQSLDPVSQVPWTNGDKQEWDTSNPLIVAAANSTYNFNEWCFLTIECVGRPDSDPITDAQRATIRDILAWGSKLSGLPVDRHHVVGHYQINGVTRTRCPVMPSQRDAFFADVLQEENDDMYRWVEHVKPAAFYAVLDQHAAIRRWPKIEDASLIRLLDTSPERLIIGTVEGEEFAGSTEWLVLVMAGGIRVCHSANALARRDIPSGGFSQADIDAARASAADAVRDSVRHAANKAATEQGA